MSQGEFLVKCAPGGADQSLQVSRVSHHRKKKSHHRNRSTFWPKYTKMGYARNHLDWTNHCQVICWKLISNCKWQSINAWLNTSQWCRIRNVNKALHFWQLWVVEGISKFILTLWFPEYHVVLRGRGSGYIWYLCVLFGEAEALIGKEGAGRKSQGKPVYQ